MSRLGKKPIEILKGVKTKYAAGLLNVEGPKGKLKLVIPEEVVLEVSDKQIVVKQGKGVEKRVNAFHGLYRSLIQNMILGVTQGYEKKLELKYIELKKKLKNCN